ncbi:MAG: Glycosyl transferase group 1 [candidate division Zixibacteria bacterium RBG-1]|nr:MAG: Glycosyl transferase group 1 [candidate division Zixibacteria bacterium RBG-1]OGC86052.1 MAG: hypothetical protein A2V73_01555 [candidate division Zixibacteria bacterium RBG_19FT_COMBO_42_43]
MKILFLADARSIHIQRWIDFFFKRGHQVSLISLEPAKNINCEKFYVPSKIKAGFLKYFLAVPEIKKIVEKLNPDLISAHFIPNYGWIGARLKRKPLVVTSWGSDILVSARKSFLHKKRTEFVLRRADLVTSDSNYLASEIAKLKVPENKILTYPMGVSAEFLSTRSKPVTANKKTFKVISIRQLEPLYNLSLLIEAIPHCLKKTHNQIEFLICGEGSQKDFLVQLAEKLEIADKVKFLGKLFQTELLLNLQNADIYVSTSLSDSSSVSLLEAMACQLIPIVTDIPGDREWIKDDQNGFLVPVSKPELLAERITEVVQNYEKYQNWTEKNLNMVKEKANLEENLKKIEQKFIELVENKK